MALNDSDGGIPPRQKPLEDRDAPMTLEKARDIARAVSHRPDGTSQAFKTLENEVSRLECLVAHYKSADSLAAFHKADREVSSLRADNEALVRLLETSSEFGIPWKTIIAALVLCGLIGWFLR